MISSSITLLRSRWLTALLLALLAMPVHTQTLTPAQLDEDLQQFQTALEQRWAYLKVGEADYQTPLRALRARARNGLTRDELGLALMRVIAFFRDGQAVTEERWPITTSRLLPDNIGYLRIPVMNAAAVETIRQWMPQFKTTKGLIVDIRDNGGGSRAALRELFPYVMNSAAAPHVANASKYPLFREFTPGQLEDRFMYREDWQGWTPEERDSIAQFKRGFQPDWKPPVQEFSDWHYLVLAQHNNAAAYHHDRPVVILMNEDCFSASDIFLSAFKGWPGVTLIGMPSAGGSSRVVAITLKNSGLKVGLGSIVSFQRDGRLYDGNGVQPDILVAPSPDSFLRGREDNVLLRAIQFIEHAARKR